MLLDYTAVLKNVIILQCEPAIYNTDYPDATAIFETDPEQWLAGG